MHLLFRKCKICPSLTGISSLFLSLKLLKLMPRKILIRTNQFPYHITLRSNNKDWFELPLSIMWKLCKQSIAKAQASYPTNIEAFVLMANHYHLLIWTPNSDIDKFMYVLNSSISKEIRIRTKRINRIFGDRYKWTLVDHERYYLQVLRYIYQNPVKAQVTSTCHDYPFSTLRYIYLNEDFEAPIYNCNEARKLLLEGFFERDLHKREIIAKALQRSRFNYPKRSSSRRAI